VYISPGNQILEKDSPFTLGKEVAITLKGRKKVVLSVQLLIESPNITFIKVNGIKISLVTQQFPCNIIILIGYYHYFVTVITIVKYYYYYYYYISQWPLKKIICFVKKFLFYI